MGARRQEGWFPCSGGARRPAEPRTAMERRPYWLVCVFFLGGDLYAFAILVIRAFAHAMASSTVGRTGRLPFCAE